MKLGKYILGLALVAVGLTSCDQENVGAIYEPTSANISFLAAEQSTLTDETSIEVPVAIGRATTDGEYTATVTLTDASEGLSLKSDKVTFATGEGIAYATIVVNGMTQGTSYTGTLSLSENDKATANTDFGKQITSTKVEVVCDYNWIEAGTCKLYDYTCSMFGLTAPFVAEDVPVINGEGSNIYRILDPMEALFPGDPDNDHDYLEFTLEGGKMSFTEGFHVSYWGYYIYYVPSDYPSYCFVTDEGNTHDFNFLLNDNDGGLYSGGRMVIVYPN